MATSVCRFSSAPVTIRPQTPYQDFALDLTGDFCPQTLSFVESKEILKLHYVRAELVTDLLQLLNRVSETICENLKPGFHYPS